jgi:hypothetical protein
VITETATVVVTWMDGVTETYDGQTRVHDGVLHIYGSGEVMHIPLANIRYWTKP